LATNTIATSNAAGASEGKKRRFRWRRTLPVAKDASGGEGPLPVAKDAAGLKLRFRRLRHFRRFLPQRERPADENSRRLDVVPADGYYFRQMKNSGD